MYSEGVCANSKAERESYGSEKKKGIGPFSIALLQNLILIDTGYKGKAGFFEMNLSGGVYEAHGEDFSFESLCLPVHTAGSIYLNDPVLIRSINMTSQKHPSPH